MSPIRFRRNAARSLLGLQLAVLFGSFSLPLCVQQGEAVASTSNSGAEQSDLQALLSKGVYWYERYRFDLASQSLGKGLLLQPNNPELIKWQGLVDLGKGDVGAARIWSERLNAIEGKKGRHALELQQMLSLSTTNRQTLAEIRYKSQQPGGQGAWVEELRTLFDSEPMGLAALEYYPLLARSTKYRDEARQRVAQLQKRYPNERRYRELATRIGEPTPKQQIQLVSAKPAAVAAVQEPNPTTPDNTAAEPAALGFTDAEALHQRGLNWIEQGNHAQGLPLLEQSVSIVPAYPWFRFDYANALNDLGDPLSTRKARQVMEDGLSVNAEPEMHFANSLFASRQERDEDALHFLNEVSKADWTLGMSQLDLRLRSTQHFRRLAQLENAGSYRELLLALEQNREFRAEPPVMDLTERLWSRMQPSVEMGYDSSRIAGTSGISNIASREIPLEVRLPLSLERSLFVRADQLSSDAGSLAELDQSRDARDFGQMDVLSDTELTQLVKRTPRARYSGYLLGAGLTQGGLRVDLGRPVGDFPVQSWVGGIQQKLDLGAGSLKIDLARRMVGGSNLSSVGAIDPVTGATWGGARRNGLSLVHYHPINPKTDWVGIARINRITGEKIPSNMEYNLQGILTRTLYAGSNNKLELGASVFLWSFDKNLRFYTFGQGGYYSPKAFGSLSIPLTWTGKSDRLAWRAQLNIGASESRQDDSLRYPGFRDVDAAVQARAGTQGGLLSNAGGPGGGTSTGLKLQLERKLPEGFSVGVFGQIDRSEGYNPDLLQVYMRWTPGIGFNTGSALEPVTPYSRF